MPTDDLRTRISDAIWGEARTIGSTLSGKAADLIADAVIREIGLKRASRPSDYGHVNYPPGYQYITDWIADE